MEIVNMKDILQDKRKIDDFLEANKNLVWKVINKSFPSLVNTYDIDDYFQEGMIGLYDAMKRFDETKKCEFSTLACICIKSIISNKIVSSRYQKRVLNNNTISLYKIISKNDDNLRIIDILKDRIDIENSVIESYDTAERHNRVMQILNNNLSPRRKEVLQSLLRLKSQVQIAKDLNCSRQLIGLDVKKILEEAAKICA